MVNPKIPLNKFFRSEADSKLQYCRFCGWKSLKHATRMVKHIQGCSKTPINLLETEAVSKKAERSASSSTSTPLVPAPPTEIAVSIEMPSFEMDTGPNSKYY